MSHHDMRSASKQKHNVADPSTYTNEISEDDSEEHLHVHGHGHSHEHGHGHSHDEEQRPTPGPRRQQPSTPEPGKVVEVTGKRGCGSTAHCWEAGSAFMSFVPQDGLEDVIVELADEEVKAGEYIALGFSDDRMMGQDYVVWCLHDSNRLYTGFNPRGQEATMSVATARNLGEMFRWELVGSHLGCRFNLRTNVLMQGLNRVTKLNDELYLLFAKGKMGEKSLGYHDQIFIASQQKYLVTDTASYKSATPVEPLFIPEVKDALVRSHGGLMVFAWLFCLASTILIARYTKRWPDYQLLQKPLWFQLHKWGNIVAVTLIVVAFILIFLAEEGKWTGPTDKNPTAHDDAVHSVIGLVASLIVFIQPIVAAFRPRPDTRFRSMFNGFHRCFGFIAWILAATAVYFATRLPVFRGYEEDDETKKKNGTATDIWIAYIVLFALVVIGLEAHMYYYEKRSSTEEQTADEIAMDARGDNYKPPPRVPINPEQEERVRKTHIRALILYGFMAAAFAASIALIVLLAAGGPEPSEIPSN